MGHNAWHFYSSYMCARDQTLVFVLEAITYAPYYLLSLSALKALTGLKLVFSKQLLLMKLNECLGERKVLPGI